MKRKCVMVLLLISMIIASFPVIALAENSESEMTIMPRWTYISEAEGILTTNGTNATVDCWVKGYYGKATKAKIIAELQVKNSATNWIPVAIWTETQDDYEAFVYESKTINTSNTYRLKVTATVWEGSQSETTTFIVD